MALVLGMDTSMNACSVALVDGRDTLETRSDPMTRGQSEALAPMIDQVMKATGRTYDDIDALAVTRGPGAFTGLRIGLAAARGLALTISKPCIGITTFDVLIRQALMAPGVTMPGDGILVIAIETKRDDVYVQAIGSDGSTVVSPTAMMAEDLAKALPEERLKFICGDATARVREELGPTGPAMEIIPNVILPDPAILAMCAQAFLDSPEDAPASPFYIRPPDVTMPGQVAGQDRPH